MTHEENSAPLDDSITVQTTLTDVAPEVGTNIAPPIAPPIGSPAFSRRELSIGGICACAGLFVGVLGSVLVASIAGGVGALTASSPIAAAATSCAVEDNPWITVGDEGRSVSMQTAGDESDGADLVDVVCVLNELDVPDSVISRLDSTRALDGRQSATWNELSASWGYHPDSGLDIVIETAQK